MPKQLLNYSKPTFKKSRKQVFWPWKWSKWPSQRPKFWYKILILEVIYQPFELKIHLKIELLRPKTMPFWTTPNQLSKSPENDFFGPQNGQKDPLKGPIFYQNGYPWFDHFWGQKSRFLDFLKVGLELFRSCLGIVLGLKSLTFRCFLAWNGDIWPLISKF